MNILILAAGQKTKFNLDEYPLCLSEFNGVPLIQYITEKCLSLKPNKIIVAVPEDDVRRHHLDSIIRLLMPGAIVLKTYSQTQGAACTALLAGKYIDNEESLLIVNGNEFLNIDFDEVIDNFCNRGLQAGVVVFDSVHPRYSYVRLNAFGYVIEAAEKNPISRMATAGFYWYFKGQSFVISAKNMIRKDSRVHDNFYICPIFNEMVLNRENIGAYLIDNSNYYPLKTDRHFEGHEVAIERNLNHGVH